MSGGELGFREHRHRPIGGPSTFRLPAHHRLDFLERLAYRAGPLRALQTSTPTRAPRQCRVSAPSACHTPLPREVMSNSGRGSSRRPTWYPPPGRDAVRLLQPPHHLRLPPHTPLAQSLTSRAAVLICPRPPGPGSQKAAGGRGAAFATAAASPQPSPIALGRGRRPRVARARGSAAARRGSGCGN